VDADPRRLTNFTYTTFGRRSSLLATRVHGMSADASANGNVCEFENPPSFERIACALPVGPVTETVTLLLFVNSAASFTVTPTGRALVNDMMSPFDVPCSLVASTR